MAALQWVRAGSDRFGHQQQRIVIGRGRRITHARGGPELWQDRHMRIALPRLLASLPDALTATIFLFAWIAPSIPGPQYVANLTLTMLIEFIVMHSSAFYAVICAASEVSRGRRLAWLSCLTALYLTFILGFALAYQSVWPIAAFAWLFVSRFVHLWTHPVEDATDTRRMMLLWVASGVTYVFGAALTVLLPLPRFGLTPEFVASMHLSGSGEWIDRPYTVLAFGALYFGVQAWLKYALAGIGPVAQHSGFGDRLRVIGAALEAESRDKAQR
jgi:hypothetical protein